MDSCLSPFGDYFDFSQESWKSKELGFLNPGVRTIPEKSHAWKKKKHKWTLVNINYVVVFEERLAQLENVEVCHRPQRKNHCWWMEPN